DIVVDAGFDSDGDGRRDQDRVLLYSQATIQSIAETGGPAPDHEGSQVLGVRGLDIDDAGRVTYSIDFGAAGSSTPLASLRSWDGPSSKALAFEGMGLGHDDKGNALLILQIEQIRVSRTGDVDFSATIGFFDDQGTRHIDREAILRWTPATPQLEEVIATKT